MFDTSNVFLLVFLSGLIGGFSHCIGMCGPIAITLGTYSGTAILPHVFYNSGRVITYTMMGGVLGFIGSFVSMDGGVLVFQKVAMIVSGALIATLGLAIGFQLPLARAIESRSGSVWLMKLVSTISHRPQAVTFLPIGMILGFIPCGLVYTILISAGRTGMEASSPLEGLTLGALVMLIFGLGTMPAMLLTGRLAGWLRNRFRKYMLVAAGIIMALSGVYFIVQGITFSAGGA